MKIYIYRTINNCVNGTSDLCQISSHKYERTKSGDIARNQAPFDKQCIINTDSLKLFSIKKPRPNIITQIHITKKLFITIIKNQFDL